ncbi:MAG: MarR family transcriptional regulator [Clostridiales bacterium]|jgi:DNA-binding MarR family transcriptional regulator|nr:MarR family transcriptional regulator [Clostridiales bacterium]
MDEVKDRKNIALIFRINNALTKQKNKKMARYDLTSIQADVLIYILLNADKGEINQLDIQAVFKLTNPTVSGIIDRLAEKNFIKRAKSVKDARFRRLLPMPKGEALLDVLLKSAHNAEEEFLVDMTNEEKDEFERLLNIALKTVESD